MNAQAAVSIPSEKAVRSSLDKFKLALQSVEPSKRQRREEALIEAYDTIKQHVDRNVTWKTIVAKFNEAYALAMHPARLRREFDEERKRRENTYSIEVFEKDSHEEREVTEQGHEGSNA